MNKEQIEELKMLIANWKLEAKNIVWEKPSESSDHWDNGRARGLTDAASELETWLNLQPE